MDALAYLRSIRNRAEAVIENARALRDEAEQAEKLWLHALEHWNQQVRTPIEAVLPSQLPDRTLGPGLRKVRDFLAPAPGAPFNPAFDEVISAVGLGEARERADHLAAAARPSDEIWLALRDMARGRQGMERAE